MFTYTHRIKGKSGFYWKQNHRTGSKFNLISFVFLFVSCRIKVFLVQTAGGLMDTLGPSVNTPAQLLHYTVFVYTIIEVNMYLCYFYYQKIENKSEKKRSVSMRKPTETKVYGELRASIS